MIDRQDDRSSALASAGVWGQWPLTQRLVSSTADLWSAWQTSACLLRLKRSYWWLLKLRNFVRDYQAHWLVPSYSQEGEDIILRRIFAGQAKGFYVDIGAHHPKRFSNTYYFYLHGWRGINVDPAPGCMQPFRKVRPRDINLESAVATGNRTLTYYEFSETSLNGFSKEISQARNENGPYRIIGEQPVTTLTLAEILDAHLPHGQPIDFLNIDVEGLDLEVLKSNDWAKYQPKVVLVEDLALTSLEDIAHSAVARLLRQQGYELYSKTVNTMIFRKTDRVLPYERDAKFE